MAKDSGIMNIVLIGGALYLAYEYFFSTPTTAATPTGVLPTTTPTTTATNPTAPLAIANISPAAASAPVVLTVQLSTSPSSVTFAINGSPVTSTGSGNTYQVSVPSNTPAGTSALTVTTPNGGASAYFTVLPAATNTNTGGNVGGYSYSSKSTYLTALVNALKAAAGTNTLNLDQWNWYMVQLGIETAGPDPSPIASQLGIARNATTDAGSYITARNALGLINYPSGLSGLAGLAAGIMANNQHPIAGRMRAQKLMLAHPGGKRGLF